MSGPASARLSSDSTGASSNPGYAHNTISSLASRFEHSALSARGESQSHKLLHSYSAATLPSSLGALSRMRSSTNVTAGDTDWPRRIRTTSWAENDLHQLRSSMAQEDLMMIKAEVQEWMEKVMGLKFQQELIISLQSGVRLCQLARTVDSSWTVPFKEDAKAGTFYARDNIAAFLKKCEDLGIKRLQLFEPSDLVERRNERRVMNTILLFSRAAMRFGFEPPLIVQFELEIEREEREQAERERRKLEKQMTLSSINASALLDKAASPSDSGTANGLDSSHPLNRIPGTAASASDLHDDPPPPSRPAPSAPSAARTRSSSSAVSSTTEEDDSPSAPLRRPPPPPVKKGASVLDLIEAELKSQPSPADEPAKLNGENVISHARMGAAELVDSGSLAGQSEVLSAEIASGAEAGVAALSGTVSRGTTGGSETSRSHNQSPPNTGRLSARSKDSDHGKTEKHVKFTFEEYSADMEDMIDRAVAERLNEIRPDNLLVFKIKRGCYQIGEGPYSYLRLVRNVLLARVGGGWMGFKMFLMRKMSLRQRASDAHIVEGNEDPEVN